MPRKVAISWTRARGLLIAVALIGGPALPASSADPSPPRANERSHPEADKINQSNPRVHHAGPGAPLTGKVFVPPALDKGKGK